MIDIAGVGNQQLKYPDASKINFESIQQYRTIAKKTIKTFANKFRPGLSDEMLKSEDAISSVATAIMFADWRWNPNYRSKKGLVRTKRSYRNVCSIWAIKAYLCRQAKASVNMPMSLDHVLNTEDTEDNAETLYGIIPSNEPQPDVVLQKKEQEEFIQTLLAQSCLTEKQEKYIRLRYFDRLTLQEIAKETGCSREAVRQTIERGLNKIKSIGVFNE